MRRSVRDAARNPLVLFTAMSYPTYRLRALPGPARVLALSFVMLAACAFGMAHVNLHLQHANRDGRSGLSLDDVIAAYHGLPGSTLLTSKINGGSMERYIPRPADKAVVESWVTGGATEATFEAPAKVLDRLCVRCHNPGGEMSQTPFAENRSAGPSFALVGVVVAPDTGMSAASLARSSHAHLFGMSMLFALVGLVFLGTDVGPRIKAVSVASPFVAVVLDIGCWWLTRWNAGFAIGIVAGGALLAAVAAWLLGRCAYELLTPDRPGTSDAPEMQ